ncbi:unnamed protein product [Brassicogethes aeneus]|uniref:Uncharacterized protein n=1 Tax=Brassicogethes aeneus TaxID=1431903 RepID=A0A9P0BGK3_BRAAE|nr:unnamed protein product [Brassicogethes aeneus]
MRLLVSKLKVLHITAEGSPDNLVKTICCEPVTEECLQRLCEQCHHKELMVDVYDEDENSSLEKWITQREVQGLLREKYRYVVHTCEIISFMNRSNFLEHFVLHCHYGVGASYRTSRSFPTFASVKEVSKLFIRLKAGKREMLDYLFLTKGNFVYHLLNRIPFSEPSKNPVAFITFLDNGNLIKSTQLGQELWTSKLFFYNR